jgi:anti-sigma factor RsiW
MSSSDMQWKIHDLFQDVFLPYSIYSYSCSLINADPSNAEWLENHYEDFPKAKTHYEDFSKAKTPGQAKHQFEASFADAGVPAVAGAPARRRRRRRRQPPARRPASPTRARSINLFMLDLVYLVAVTT